MCPQGTSSSDKARPAYVLNTLLCTVRTIVQAPNRELSITQS